jgi:hypothetical protein
MRGSLCCAPGGRDLPGPAILITVFFNLWDACALDPNRTLATPLYRGKLISGFLAERRDARKVDGISLT